MARYPSGITPLLGEHVDDVRVRAARMALEMDAHPVGATAPCMNPECAGPVDYVGTGHLTLYCSTTCRNRTSYLRTLITDELELLEETLDETKHKQGIPRQEYLQRARMLRWWAARLTPITER
ncbi:hypothetical protein [Janibacter terrae]|uniref:hypothetical protein n=1 Tax=Janibacter terrae TaxID=103817 RepID=UPI000836A223|nr:hypothetical protein [Janibacter terrae]